MYYKVENLDVAPLRQRCCVLQLSTFSAEIAFAALHSSLLRSRKKVRVRNDPLLSSRVLTHP